MKDMKMKEIKILLPKSQQAKFETVKWLTDPMGPRGSGRTYLLALSFIMHSLNYRTWIHVYNHDSHISSGKELLEQIITIVNGIKGVRLLIKGEHSNKIEILVEPIPEKVYTNIKYEEI